jgi:hypothetical protein
MAGAVMERPEPHAKAQWSLHVASVPPGSWSTTLRGGQGAVCRDDARAARRHAPAWRVNAVARDRSELPCRRNSSRARHRTGCREIPLKRQGGVRSSLGHCIPYERCASYVTGQCIMSTEGSSTADPCVLSTRRSVNATDMVAQRYTRIASATVGGETADSKPHGPESGPGPDQYRKSAVLAFSLRPSFLP